MPNHRAVVTSFLLFCGALVLPAVAGADNASSPYRTLVKVDGARLHALLGDSDSGKARLRKIPAITLEGRIPGFGFFKGELRNRRAKNWPSYWQSGQQKVLDDTPIALLRGRFGKRRLGTRAHPFAAAVFLDGRKVRLKVNFNGKGALGRQTRLFELNTEIPARGKQHLTRIRRIPETALQSHRCQEALPAGHAGNPAAAASSNFEPLLLEFPTLPATLRVLEIATKADYNWYTQFGSNSNSQISTVINAAESLYENQLSVTFTIKQQVVITSSGQNYTSTDATDLLYEFGNQVLSDDDMGSADIFHLFTGRDLAGDTIGIAFIGAICYAPSYSFGVVQHLDSSLDYLTFAHELGHNFSAQHDTSTTNNIMYPAITGSTTFSSTSVSQVSSHISNYGTCLGTQTDGSPTPTPVPGATPTPTTTPDGGGGGGGNNPGDDSDLPSVTLTSSLSKTGVLSVVAGASGGTPRSTCSLDLLLSQTAAFDKTTRVTLSDGLATEVSLSIQIPIKIRTSKKPKVTGKVFIKAAYTCTDAAIENYSNQVKVDGSKIKSAKYSPKSKWIKTAAKKISTAAAL